MKDKPKPTIYAQMQRFADITKTSLKEGNLERARHCAIIAEEIFNNGTSEVKNIVENVYVFSVTSFMELKNYKVESIFAASLLSVYIHQINTSGV